MPTSEKVAHTPGPWITSATQDDRRFVLDHDGRWIAEIQDRANFDLDNGASANMRLIAAAPDLLEALEMFADCFNHVDQAAELGFEDEYETARAAIAKARGA